VRDENDDVHAASLDPHPAREQGSRFRERRRWPYDPGVLRWARTLPPVVADVALAVAVTGFVMLSAIGERQHHERVPAVGVALLAVLAPAIAMRRRFPALALAIVVGVQVGLSATRTAPGANVPAELIIPYSTAVYGSRRVRLAAAVAAGAVLVAIALPWQPFPHLRGDMAGLLFGGAGAWLIGTLIRGRRAQSQQLAERADRLERERDLLAREAVAEERLRIARELHDVVAHNLSVVVVQAQALGPAVARDPELARNLALSIEDVGREAMDEMRHLLGVLRASSETADAGEDAATEALGPQPGLDRLPALVEQMRQAGVAVDVTVRGASRALPPAVALSAYRIVQEALTNVLKHAGPASARVLVEYGDAGVVLSVTDDGRGAAANLSGPAPRGHGLVGMRERAALFGGELAAGPRPGGGFEVRARIPAQS
jgi:signal transduction histidine kinase